MALETVEEVLDHVAMTDNSLVSEFRLRTESMLIVTKQIIHNLVSVVFNWVLISTMEIMLGNSNHLESKKEESEVAQLCPTLRPHGL